MTKQSVCWFESDQCVQIVCVKPLDLCTDRSILVNKGIYFFMKLIEKSPADFCIINTKRSLLVCHFFSWIKTRMHSSGIRTARLLIVSRSIRRRGGGRYPRGGFTQRGCVCPGQGCLPARGVADTIPPVDRQALVKTLPSQTSFADAN